MLIHRDDAPWLSSGRVPREGRSGAGGHVADLLPLLHWTPRDPDGLLDDGDDVGGIEVIHTPGHSPGHVVLRHTASNVLMVGDAVFNRKGLTMGPDAFAADAAQRDRTLERLPRDVSAVGFAHGAPLRGAEVDRFAAFLESFGRR